MTSPELILASTSPRRQQLLKQLEVNFDIVPVDIDESVLPGEKAADYVIRLAKEKALAGAKVSSYRLPVLGADTTVVVAEQILGKPKDKQDFINMMQSLSGRTHLVLTAIALISDKTSLHDLVSTEVTFRSMTLSEIETYWESGEPQDKAGGYAIQGIAAKFIERINGSYTAVVGLPLCETEQLLKHFRKPL